MEKNYEPLSVPQIQEDRFSDLPDDILVDILSTLKVKEAAQTSVLSHRWLNLWTDVPRLHFDSTENQRRPCPRKQREKHFSVFANFVNHVLHLRKGSSLQELRIYFDLDKRYFNKIDKWLACAFERGVRKLELNFSKLGFIKQAKEDSYSFPNQLPNKTTTFDVCLKTLYLTAVNISGEAIECLLLKCPLLEDLRVHGSRTLINVVISGPSLLLKHLQITGCFRSESITISNMNIVSLRVTVKDKGVLLLSCLPMLTEVWINGGMFSNKSILFSQFSCLLSKLTVLTLEFLYPSELMGLHKFPQLKNLRRLVLVASSCGDESMIGLTSLIDSCPHLVEFALMLNPGRLEDRGMHAE